MAMITALSSRGQIVLPKKLRDALNLEEGTQFVVFSDQDNILLKPIKLPGKSDFAGVLRQASTWAKNSGICEEDITEAIKAVRHRKNHENRD